MRSWGSDGATETITSYPVCGTALPCGWLTSCCPLTLSDWSHISLAAVARSWPLSPSAMRASLHTVSEFAASCLSSLFSWQEQRKFGLGESGVLVEVSGQALLKKCAGTPGCPEACFGAISSFKNCVFLPSLSGLYAASCPSAKIFPFKTKGKRLGVGAVRKETYKNLEWVDWSSTPCVGRGTDWPVFPTWPKSSSLLLWVAGLRPFSTNESPHQSLAVRVLESTRPLPPLSFWNFPWTLSGQSRGYWVVSAVGWGMRKCLKTEASHTQSRWENSDEDGDVWSVLDLLFWTYFWKKWLGPQQWKPGILTARPPGNCLVFFLEKSDENRVFSNSKIRSGHCINFIYGKNMCSDFLPLLTLGKGWGQSFFKIYFIFKFIF